MIDLEETLKEAIEDLLRQFAYRGEKDGRLVLTTGGLSALEAGFAAIGWSDPHPVPGSKPGGRLPQRGPSYSRVHASGTPPGARQPQNFRGRKRPGPARGGSTCATRA
jgi:hypothetical protein